ncbi:MAG: hypothetical protein OXU20_17130 [Myxococcales bacterium]|nr:hypothetical protein [Myxococcales bacterium]
MDWGRISLWVPLIAAPIAFFARSTVSQGAEAMLVQVALMVSLVAIIAHGANWLVTAACRIAAVLGVSHLVIGLTIVAIGTSAPEIAASLVAGFQGNGDVAVANVVGSNVFNICFILGGVAAIARTGLTTGQALLVRDTPVLLLGTALVFLFVGGLPGVQPPTEAARFWPQLLNLRLERAEGVILLGVLTAYLLRLYARREAQAADDGDFGQYSISDLPLLLVGLLAVVVGCRALVGEATVVDGVVRGYGALWFARVWDVPDYVVGITIIAAGTSAPELVVSFVAALRGAFGLSAGNLVGSDIFNFYGVLGLSGLLLQQPAAPPVAISPQLVAGVLAPMLVVLCAGLFMWTGRRISRLEGGFLVLLGLLRWAYDFFHGWEGTPGL